MLLTEPIPFAVSRESMLLSISGHTAPPSQTGQELYSSKGVLRVRRRGGEHHPCMGQIKKAFKTEFACDQILLTRDGHV